MLLKDAARAGNAAAQELLEAQRKEVIYHKSGAVFRRTGDRVEYLGRAIDLIKAGEYIVIAEMKESRTI